MFWLCQQAFSRMQNVTKHFPVFCFDFSVYVHSIAVVTEINMLVMLLLLRTYTMQGFIPNKFQLFLYAWKKSTHLCYQKPTGFAGMVL